jgi:hypothetical protein
VENGRALTEPIRERAGEGGIAVEIDPFEVSDTPIVVIRQPGEALVEDDSDRGSDHKSHVKSD